MKLSLFSVSYAGLWGQHSLNNLEFITQAKALGYDAVMLAGKRPHLSILDSDPNLIEQLNARLKKEEIECAVVAGYTDFSGAGAAEVPWLELQIAYVESLSKLAAALGAGIVRVFTAYETRSQPLSATWNRTVTSLQECCDRAARHAPTPGRR